MSGTCSGCAAILVPRSAWEKLSDDEKDQRRQQGHRRHSARSLCVTCYSRARRSNSVADFAAKSTPRAVAVENFHFLSRTVSDLSRIRQVQIVAPWIGMTPQALERALIRDQKAAS